MRSFSDYKGILHIVGYSPYEGRYPIHEDTIECEVATILVEVATRHLALPPSQIRLYIPPHVHNSTNHGSAQQTILKDPTLTTVQQALSPHFSSGDVLLNLLPGLDSMHFAQWCTERGGHFLCTSFEHFSSEPREDCYTESLVGAYERYLQEQPKTLSLPSSLFAFGTAPGLTNLYALQAIRDFAASCQLDEALTDSPAQLARKLHLEGILLTDRDTQESKSAVFENIFSNTYSVSTLLSEAVMNAELPLPQLSKLFPSSLSFSPDFPLHFHLPQMGLELVAQAETPLGPCKGHLIRSDEALSLSIALNRDKSFSPFLGRITQPCPAAQKSFEHLKAREYQEQESAEILCKKLSSGQSEIGAQLISRKYGSWWCGHSLSLEQAREIVPFANATLVQNALAILGGVLACLREPSRGFMLPENIDPQKTWDYLEPFLGRPQSVLLKESKETRAVYGDDGEILSFLLNS